MIFQEFILDSFCRNTERIAMVYNDDSFTYRDIYVKICQLVKEMERNCLKKKYVAICCKENFFAALSLLGCWLLGAIPVPIDYYLSKERVDMYFRCIHIEAVIIDSNVNINYNGIKHINLVDLFEKYSYNAELTLKHEWDESTPAYIYFTSGSTGNPKGVMGKYSSLYHFIHWEKECFQINSKDVFGQITSPGFDPFLRDILTPFLAGAKIVFMPNRSILLSSKLFFRWLNKNRITVMHCTPLLLFEMCKNIRINEKSHDMRLILIAGQRLLKEYVEKFFSSFPEKTQFVNLYGPTETTLAKCYHIIQRKYNYENSIPVGKPISDEKVSLINDKTEIIHVPNCIGEVAIGTQYGTLGYVNADIEEKMIYIDSFSKYKLYRTGDLAFYDENMDIIIVKRKDRQVKIRGIRIELEEIENLCYQHLQIENALAYVEINKLCLAIVPKKVEYTKEVIIEKLGNVLPRALLPQSIKFISEVPLNQNGKIDYEKLKK